jgi:multiple antibiotic resistance protein
MPPLSELLSTFILLWAVIDPIGTIPVFISATEGHPKAEQKRIALVAATTAAGILLFFIVVGEIMLRAMGVSILAFQIAGGLILFLFALSMIFGESKPDGEKRTLRSASDVAVFPLATPSLASPGAMMAVVLMTENETYSILNQAITSLLLLAVVASAWLLMLSAGIISRIIGEGGIGIVSRVMGLILASIATSNVLEGIKEYFQ